MKNSRSSVSPAYSVGFARPPKQYRFRKGTSGNPGGRRKGVLNLSTVLGNALKEPVVVVRDGQRTTISKLEAAVRRLVDKAINGDMSAFRLLSDLSQILEGPAPRVSLEEMERADRKLLESLLGRFAKS